MHARDPATILGWEDLLEREMTTHSSILAWRIPWTEEPGGLQSMGSQELDVTERLTLYLQRVAFRMKCVNMCEVLKIKSSLKYHIFFHYY